MEMTRPSASGWSPTKYLEFEDERTRPARDLLAGVPLAEAELVVDIGCGPGNSTELLLSRFPDARVVGLDSSAEMLSAAAQRVPQAQFLRADVADWKPGGDVDLLYGNAIFQWVPDHLAVLEKLLAALRPGGVLAVQVPDNLDEPSHALMAEVARAGEWWPRLADAEEARDHIPAASEYYDRLIRLCRRVDIWRTVYHHPLNGAAGIVSMLRSTGLRPYLAPLEESERAEFLAEFEARIAAAYPALADGKVLLRFPRLFVVATRR